MLTEDQKERIWTKIHIAGLQELSSKDVELLEKVILSESMIKVLGNIYAHIQELGTSMLGMDLSSPAGIQEAQRNQGAARGGITAIELVLMAITAPSKPEGEDEEEEEEEPNVH